MGHIIVRLHFNGALEELHGKIRVAFIQLPR